MTPSRRAPIPRGTKPIRKSPIKHNAKRAAKRLARTHGPKAFIEFTKEQPCAACGIVGYSENAHVLGNGGLGRKKDWTTVAPLCGPTCADRYIGCHKLFDLWRWRFDAMYPEFNAETAVAEHQAAWKAFQGAEE